MDIDKLTKLLDVAVSLLQVIIWPLLILFLLIYLGNSIKKFIENMGEFSLKAGSSGVEATAKKQQIEVAASLGAATATAQIQNTEGDKKIYTESLDEVARLVSQIVTPETSEKLRGASILWVDDQPSNNTNERNALE